MSYAVASQRISRVSSFFETQGGSTLNDPNRIAKRKTQLAIASIAIIILLSISLVYYGKERLSSQPNSSSTSGQSQSSSGQSTTGEQSASSSSKVPPTPEEMAGLLDCTTQEKAFLIEGETYSQLGYPQLRGDFDNPINALSPAYVYFVQFPAGEATLGDVQAPMIGVCQALGEAISSLGINSSNYRLAQFVVDDGVVNTDSYGVSDPTWTFYFAQVYQGFWIDGTVNEFSASAEVNSVKGSVDHIALDNLSLPSTPGNFTMNFNSTQALEAVRHTTVMNEGPSLVANGTLDSIDLRLATVYTVKGGAYASIQPVNASSTIGELRLLWIITTSAPDYVGYFVVDAETGQVVEAEGESTQPCGGSPNCGIVYETQSGVDSAPFYAQTSGLSLAPESFQINGSAVGLNGTYSVLVPDVITMRQGSSGIIGVNLTGISVECAPQQTSVSGGATTIVFGGICAPFTYDVTPSTGALPPGVTASFSEQSVGVEMGASVSDSMQISVSPNAPQGTYVIFLDSPPYTAARGYIVLSIWNGQGSWPVLPMLTVPLAGSTQNQPVIVNGTSIFRTDENQSARVLANPGPVGWLLVPGDAPTSVAVDQAGDRIFTEAEGSGGGVDVSVVDGVSGNVVHNILIQNAGLSEYPNGLAYDPNSGMLFAVSGDPGELSVVDTNTWQVVANLTETDPWGVAVNPNTDTVYVVHGGESGSLSVIDGSSLNLIATVPIAGTNDGASVAVNTVTDRIYVTGVAAGVTVISGANNAVLATIAVESEPTAVAVNSQTNTIYVADGASNSVSVINGTTNEVNFTIAVGNNPDGIAVNPEDGEVYVSDSFSGDVAIISGTSDVQVAVAIIGLTAQPFGIAVDPSTSTIYIADAGSSPSQISWITYQYP